MLKTGTTDLITRVKEGREEQARVLRHFSLGLAQRMHILLLGVGAVGNEIAKNLALCGVKRVTLVDRDIVEAPNLAKSVFFTAEDIGRYKVHVVAEGMRRLSPDMEVIPIIGEVQREVGLGLLREQHAVICALDSGIARTWVSRMSARLRVSWCEVGIGELSARWARYNTQAKRCFECSRTQEDTEAGSTSCLTSNKVAIEAGRLPATPMTASLAGAGATMEALLLAQKRLAPNAWAAPDDSFEWGLNWEQPYRQERGGKFVRPRAGCVSCSAPDLSNIEVIPFPQIDTSHTAHELFEAVKSRTAAKPVGIDLVEAGLAAHTLTFCPVCNEQFGAPYIPLGSELRCRRDPKHFALDHGEQLQSVIPGGANAALSLEMLAIPPRAILPVYMQGAVEKVWIEIGGRARERRMREAG